MKLRLEYPQFAGSYPQFANNMRVNFHQLASVLRAIKSATSATTNVDVDTIKGRVHFDLAPEEDFAGADVVIGGGSILVVGPEDDFEEQVRIFDEITHELKRR